jgi:RNA polymerase sigma factor (sigma-70 family)
MTLQSEFEDNMLQLEYTNIPSDEDTPDKYIEDLDKRMIIDKLLSSLSPRQSKVLKMRFGIDMNTDHTLEEIAYQFDVQRERIRQIEAKALRHLRHPMTKYQFVHQKQNLKQVQKLVEEL